MDLRALLSCVLTFLACIESCWAAGFQWKFTGTLSVRVTSIDQDQKRDSYETLKNTVGQLFYVLDTMRKLSLNRAK